MIVLVYFRRLGEPIPRIPRAAGRRYQQALFVIDRTDFRGRPMDGPLSAPKRLRFRAKSRRFANGRKDLWREKSRTAHEKGDTVRT